ncbi:hypothetical protein ABZ916_23605 [Streptomyces sp. NPDC046853]|uniref:hypothetical protein n=1 Tax=Streptomyces sp. NPDC046853 TaxID=3154920 RepID=UPI00340DACFC
MHHRPAGPGVLAGDGGLDREAAERGRHRLIRLLAEHGGEAVADDPGGIGAQQRRPVVPQLLLLLHGGRQIRGPGFFDQVLDLAVGGRPLAARRQHRRRRW